MPNFQQFLNDEIRRLAKKEVKAGCEPLKAQIATLRKTIIEQNRRIKELEKLVPTPVNVQADVQPEAADGKSVRITAERIKNLRKKLGLTKVQFATMLEVSLPSVIRWENGSVSPRDAQKLRIATVRDMGKRELKKLMETKGISMESATKRRALIGDSTLEQRSAPDSSQSEREVENET